MFTSNKTTEFKSEYADDIKNTVVAFANCDGGTLYIGVNDDGSVCGIQNIDDRGNNMDGSDTVTGDAICRR